MSVSFDQDIEGGNGVDFQERSPGTWSFRLRPDTNSDDQQWFLFRVRGAAGTKLRFELRGTDLHNIPSHWDHSLPVFSADGGESWSHIVNSTQHKDQRFYFEHEFTADEELLAFHYPYGVKETNRALDRWAAHPAVIDRWEIGQSVQGRPIEAIRIADPSGRPLNERRGLWAISRQHAGETSASFTLEGMVNFVLSDDPAAAALRQSAALTVIPLVNPDGAVLGHYRNNAAGVNLNRVWNDCDRETSPEVFAIKQAISEWLESGHRYDWFGDFHSDSEGWGHYSFYPGPKVQPARYSEPQNYFRDAKRQVLRIADLAPAFNPEQGESNSDAPGLARMDQMFSHGVMSLIFEAGYGEILWGEMKGQFLTPDIHRSTGAAIGRMLAEEYGGG